GRCRFAQPPATCFDASGISLIRCIMCGRDNYKGMTISRSVITFSPAIDMGAENKPNEPA
ncbi:MAG: hypothetical protein WCJ40_19900, partial [Planctomycetota bacterium]